MQAAQLALNTALMGPAGALRGFLVGQAGEWLSAPLIDRATETVAHGVHGALTEHRWESAAPRESDAAQMQSGAMLAGTLIVGGAINKAGRLGARGAQEGGRTAQSSDYVDLLSPAARKHILHGDAPGSGGHLWPGQPGKTPFPKTWSGDKIAHEVSDIVTSPNTKWYAQKGNGGHLLKDGRPAKWVSYELRDGVEIRVIYMPATGRVVSAFPHSGPKPNYKLID